MANTQVFLSEDTLSKLRHFSGEIKTTVPGLPRISVPALASLCVEEGLSAVLDMDANVLWNKIITNQLGPAPDQDE